MTVCIAAIYEHHSILGASDRMLTAGDIQFQPDQSKLYPLTKSIVGMIAGDVAIHSEIYAEMRQSIKDRLEIDSSRWLSVKDIAADYTTIYGDIRRRRAERDLLVPLGLTSDTFIARQSQMRPDLVTKLTTELLNYKLPDHGLIIAGIDEDGPQLYVAMDGKVTCANAVGFAAIGAGSWHAQSQFMFAKYARNASTATALYLVYAAKKRAETAPGVGSHTDMFFMGPQPGSYDVLSPKIVTDISKIYDANIKDSRRVYERTEKKVEHYLTTRSPASTVPEVQQELPAIPDGPAPTDTKDAAGGTPSTSGKDDPK